jgi:hypothetical protein
MLRTTGERADTRFVFAAPCARTFGSFDDGLKKLSIAFCRLLTIHAMLL